MTWMPGGYKDWFSIRFNEDEFQLKFNRRASTLYQNFEDAADNAAQLLYRDWGHKPLYLALSGGLDSELVAKALLKNKIPFTPVIVKVDNINHLETWYAEYWCYLNNITPVILSFSPAEFSKQTIKFFPALQKVKNYSLTAILSIYEYAVKHGGCGIYSGGDINLDFKRKEFFCSSLDFVSNIVNAGKHPTAFFMYTPELVLSYIHQFDVEKDEQYNKVKFYQVAPRPKIQYLEDLWYNPDYANPLYHLGNITKTDVTPESVSRQKFWYGTKEQIIENLSP